MRKYRRAASPLGVIVIARRRSECREFHHLHRRQRRRNSKNILPFFPCRIVVATRHRKAGAYSQLCPQADFIARGRGPLDAGQFPFSYHRQVDERQHAASSAVCTENVDRKPALVRHYSPLKPRLPIYVDSACRRLSSHQSL